MEAGRKHPAWAKTHLGQTEIAWNDIFNSLAPLLVDEASEETLDKQLDDLAYLHAPEPPPLPDDAGGYGSVTAAPDAVHDVKVQFLALGLIERSTRRHPVNDKNTYWSLTTAGHDQMLRLRAIRRRPREGESPGPTAATAAQGDQSGPASP